MKERVLRYIIGTKLNSVIGFLLQQFSSPAARDGSRMNAVRNSELSKEVLDLIMEEVRQIVSRKITSLFEALVGDQDANLEPSFRDMEEEEDQDHI